MKIHDVSLEISDRMLVYPNNTPPKIRFTRLIPAGNSNLSEILLGSHTGTHVDSPLHTRNGASGVESLSLASFVGRSRVLDLTSIEHGIKREHLLPHRIRRGEIILFKTKNSLRGYQQFYTDFVYLEEDAAELLASKRIRTLGHDYIAIQKFRSGNVNVHRTLLEGGVTIFEGLDLSMVSPGRYLFVGLPLKVRAEAAPARVLLIED